MTGNADHLNWLTAAAAGLLSFLSPCVLPLVPGYVSYISGVSLQNLKAGDSRITRRVFRSSLLFVLGFSFVFIALGASATAVGKLLLDRISALRQVAGLVVILFGAHLTGIVRIPFLNYEKKMEAKRPLTSAGAFLVGAAFAFGWTPCIGPILAGILTLASTQQTVGQGITLLVAYSLGLGVPFLITSFGVQTVWARFRRYVRAFEVASGLLLIAIGALMFFDRIGMLAQYLGFFNRFSM